MKKARFRKKKYALRNAFIDNGYSITFIDDKVRIDKQGRERHVSITPLNDYGYSVIWLGGTIKKTFYIHRLVYELFNGKIKEGYEIDHIDNNVYNNHPDNLRMISKSENTSKAMQRSLDRGLHKAEHLKKKIYLETYGSFLPPKEYNSIAEAAADLNCSQSTICDNLKRRTKFFRKNYVFHYVNWEDTRKRGQHATSL